MTNRSMKTFTTLWAGQLISTIGSGVTSFALGVWLVDITGKATPFALVALFSAIPAIVLAPIAGTVVDRYSRRTIMIAADTVAALNTLVIALLILTGDLQAWHIYLMAFIGSSAGAFQEPAFQAAIPMLVPKEELGRANGMVSAIQAVPMLLSPILGGVVYTLAGLGGAIIIDFVTYFFAVGALLMVAIPDPEESAESAANRSSALQEALFGLRYIFARRGLLAMLVYFAIVNFAANFAAVLIAPMVLTFTTAAVLGIIQAVSGIGMIAGSIVMSAWGGFQRRMLGVYAFIGVFSVAFILIGLRPNAVLIGAGFALLMFTVPIGGGHAAVIWQTKVPPDVQGRVFSARSMLSRALMPVAFLIAGPLADNVFSPLMLEGGTLAPVFGPLLGVGPGRGIGIMFLAAGAVILLATGVAVLTPSLRNVEDDLPDYIPDEAIVEAVPAR